MSRDGNGRLSSASPWLPVAFSVLCLCVTTAFADPVFFPSGTVISDRVDTIEPGDVGQEPYGVPIFRIDENRWFDVTIDFPDHPESAFEVEEIRNRDVQQGKDSKRTEVFPDPNDMMRDIRLRFHYRFG